MSDEAYPYIDMNGPCRFVDTQAVATINGFKMIEPGNEMDLQAAVANIGPVSVLIDYNHTEFKQYQSNILYVEQCGTELGQLRHAVLVVGYGTEGGQDYWLVKNSWGTQWGLGGYIKMARNRNNHCGIATYAFVPFN